MATVEKRPPLLRPFTFQGIDFTGKVGIDQAVAKCPFCEREDKFYVDEEKGLWDCKICSPKGGNIHTFLKLVYDYSKRVKCDYTELASERGLISPDTLEEWGLVRSFITGEWMLPAYNVEITTRRPKLKQLYLWRKDFVEDRMRFICQSYQHTDEPVKTAHGFFMAHWDARKQNVAVLEGFWDGTVFDEIIRHTDVENGVYSHIGSESASLYANYNVIAVPSANVFYENWALCMAGKHVAFFCDNDHPRKNSKTGDLIDGAGIAGVKRNSKILMEVADRPASVRYLKWGPDGYDPRVPNRYDVRDHLKQRDTDPERVPLLGELLDMVEPVPDEWFNHQAANVLLPPCDTWENLVGHWKKAMHWNEGLDHALPVMLSCAASVPLPEDQLWVEVRSPPSTGKTEMADAMAKDAEHVFEIDIFKGLHSGTRTPDGSDASLLSLIKGKCLIITDADTIIRMPNKEQILSEFRRAYDRNSSTHYRNGVSNQYKDWSFTTIICGTESLDALDESELGQRFVRIVIMDRVDDIMEVLINENKLNKMRDLYRTQPIMNGKGASTEEKLTAQMMTGGYLHWLRNNIGTLIANIEMSDEVVSQINTFARFAAYFRARPSKNETEKESREQSTRLSGQLGKLAYCLTAIFGKNYIDKEIMRRVAKVALDTGRGTTFNIAKILAPYASEGLDVETIASNLLAGSTEIREYLRFLQKLGMVESYVKEGKIGLGTRTRWRITHPILQLYGTVTAAFQAT